MASIAYVSDYEMIEYHRLHGHRKIAFWRFSHKKFSDFNQHDFLFFLCKTKRQEKGIVGYGRLKQIRTLTLSNLWKQYKQQTGFHTFDQLELSVNKLNKKVIEHNEKLNILELEDVIYLKYPIYLSEFGYKLNKQVESYVYIDQNNNITSQVLMKAATIGLDLWSEIQEKSLTKESPILNSLLYQISLDIKEFQLFKSPRHRRIINEYKKAKELEVLVNNDNIGYDLYNKELKIYIPMINQLDKDLLATYGLLQYLKKNKSEIKTKYYLLFNSEVTDKTKSLFSTLEAVCLSL